MPDIVGEQQIELAESQQGKTEAAAFEAEASLLVAFAVDKIAEGKSCMSSPELEGWSGLPSKCTRSLDETDFERSPSARKKDAQET